MVRNLYGAITASNDAAYLRGSKIVRRAIVLERLPMPYVDFDARKQGSALNIDIYDLDGAKVLVQIRRTTGTRYGLSRRVAYFVVQAIGRGVRVAPAASAHHSAHGAAGSASGIHSCDARFQHGQQSVIARE